MTTAVVTSIVPLLAATVAVLGVRWTITQKDRSERRAEWWRRLTWALDRTESDRPTEAEIAWLILLDLLSSELATDTESDMITELAVHT